MEQSANTTCYKFMRVTREKSAVFMKSVDSTCLISLGASVLRPVSGKECTAWGQRLVRNADFAREQGAGCCLNPQAPLPTLHIVTLPEAEDSGQHLEVWDVLYNIHFIICNHHYIIN